MVRFTVITLGVTLLIGGGFAWLLSRQMVEDALNGAALEAAQAVTLLVTPNVRPDDFASPTPDRIAAWQHRLRQIIGTMDIARIKVWNARGQVVFSDDPELIGKSFPLEQQEELREALEGHVEKEVSELTKSENEAERRYGRLLEIYVPVVPPGTDQVAGVYEVYRSYAPIQAKISGINRLIWGWAALAFGLLYASLFTLVRGANRQVLRLASFPTHNPNPVIETDLSGHVRYLNPEAARLFPDMTSAGPRHPFLSALPAVADELQQSQKRSLVREIQLGDAWYQQVVTYLPEAGLIRVYAFDVTDRKDAEDEVLQQLSTLSALYTSAQKLSQSLDLQQLAEYITHTSVEVFGTSLAWLGRAKADGFVRPLSQFQASGSSPQGSVRLDDGADGSGPTGEAISSGFPVVINDLAAEPARASWRAAVEAGFRSRAAFPLISRDHPFGILNLYGDRAGFFTPKRVDFFRAYAHLAAAALENARLFEDAGRRLEQLQAARDIDAAISGSLDVRLTLQVFLEKVTTQLRVDAADVLLLNAHTQRLEYAAGRGFRSKGIEQSSLRLGEGHAGRAALERSTIAVPNISESGRPFVRAPLLSDEKFAAYYAVPLLAKGQVKGVLEVFHRSPLDPDQEWHNFLQALAGQAAIGIDNATLFVDLQRANADLTLAYETTLEGWSRALDLRDKETEGHTERVTELTMRLARTMGVRESDLVQMRRGALLHDIGKMGIPDHILFKPGPLTEEEWEIMRRHPAYAYELLSPIPYLRPSLDIPYSHHEKWDGSGYPRRLAGEQIPLAARIFAVADVWDALRSDRPYRSAWPEAKALAYIQEQAGRHFDPTVIEAFLRMFRGHADVLARASE